MFIASSAPPVHSSYSITPLPGRAQRDVRSGVGPIVPAPEDVDDTPPIPPGATFSPGAGVGTTGGVGARAMWERRGASGAEGAAPSRGRSMA